MELDNETIPQAAEIEESQDEGFDMKKIREQSKEAFYELQKSSYTLSQLTRVIDWASDIKIYPKVQIPVPRTLHKRDK